MESDTFFSIVIPTRNRSDTILSTLDTCLSQKEFESYEIVINDNSDDAQTENFIHQLCESNSRAREKIRYARRQTVCSMSENFDESIRRAVGLFVIVIGDDDGILPNALREIYSLIQAHDVSVIKWKNGLYNWPDMSIAEAKNYLGFSVSRSVEKRNCWSELKKSLITLSYDNLPMLYINSAVRRDVIDFIRDKDGKVFRSQSPDIYSAVVLAYQDIVFIEATIPFTLAGLSRHSNGVSFSFSGTNASPRSDFTTLNTKAGIHHHPAVPNLNIFPYVAFAETFYHAKSHHFESDDTVQLSRHRLMEACVARADTEVEAVRAELLRVCEDDADLADFTRGLIAAKTETLPPPRLKPAQLGFDGENLHLDPRDHGVVTIADAVALVHRIVWPADAPLRYDVPSAAGIRTDLEVTLQDLQQTRGALVQRTGDLDLALEDLVRRSADLETTLTDIGAVRELLIDRTTRLEAALAECHDFRSRLAADH